jgi:hypothetical protein
MQESFSRHFGSPIAHATSETDRPFQTDAEAKAARDARYRELRLRGIPVTRSVLRGQLRQYWSFGVPCGIVAPCYYVTHCDYRR